MSNTSLSYAFADLDVDQVIRDAFAQCGVNAAVISGWQYSQAKIALNFVLTQWISKKGLNLFTVEQNILQIVPQQRLYALPPNTSKILECILANANQSVFSTSTYQASNGQNPVSIFQKDPGYFNLPFANPPYTGWVACCFPNPQPIQYVGIQLSNPAFNDDVVSCQFSIQCSFNALPDIPETAWMTILETPRQAYYAHQTQWFSLPFTKKARSWRVVGTLYPPDGQGVANLTWTHVLWEIPYNSQPMVPVGRDQYTFYPANSQQGQSSIYYTNRAPQPTVDVWITPDESWEFFVYNRVRSIQDAGSYTNRLDITPRFLEAAATGLAARLARLYAPEKIQILTALADQQFSEVAREDVENVDLQLSLNGTGGR